MGILEKLNSSLITTYSPPQEHPPSDTPTHSGLPSTTSRKKTAVVDGMAEVQSLVKPPGIATCNELAEHFVNRLFNKYNGSDEIRLVFDRYDLPMS